MSNTTEPKLDAILNCLNEQYKSYACNESIYRLTDDKSYLFNPFTKVGFISAWLAFSDDNSIQMNDVEISSLLDHLESDKLIVSDIVEGEKQYKIIAAGILHIEKEGYSRKIKQLNFENKSKMHTYYFSIAALIISVATFIYTVFIKK